MGISRRQRRRSGDRETAGLADPAADQHPGRGRRVLGAGQEEAEDPPAQQPGRRRRAGRCLLGHAVRPDLLRAASRPCLGAAMGALTGSMADVGIDDKFINGVKERVTPGTSALFLLSSDAVVEQGKGPSKAPTPS